MASVRKRRGRSSNGTGTITKRSATSFEVKYTYKDVTGKLPECLYCYDIRHGDNVWFATLADHVGVNHAGSVICCEPFPPIKSCGVMRNTADGQPIRGRYNWVDEAKMTIAEYIERYDELRKKIL